MPRLHLTRGRTALAALALLLLLLPLGAVARPSGPPPPGGAPPGASRGQQSSENRLEGIVERIGLDEKTLAAVDGVLDASRTRGRTLRRDLREAHEVLRGLLDAATPDETAIFAQVDRISGLQGEMEKNRLGTLIRVRALLSPDARERLLEAMKKERPPRRRRHEGPPPPNRPW